MENDNSIERHIKTHSEKSVEDKAAVSSLEDVFSHDGKIITGFTANDKWPNHDGHFEYVKNPNISRQPVQEFIVQIKGTNNVCEKDGEISYSLRSLAFPAFMKKEVSANPGILFLVVNPNSRNQRRYFWKYMSEIFLKSIDFSKDSTTIKFDSNDEILDTEDGINIFCKKLDNVIKNHLFIKELSSRIVDPEDAKKSVIQFTRNVNNLIEDISKNKDSKYEYLSQIIICLRYICCGCLILNASKYGDNNNLKSAWEIAIQNKDTKYLSVFTRGLKYIENGYLDEGQYERVMLKYYDYLWDIRKFMKDSYGITVLDKLENFPFDKDAIDEAYKAMIADTIEKNNTEKPSGLRATSYYVIKQESFYVGKERYFEITLQLAGLFATKFHRITLYSKKKIATQYAIQISYKEAEYEMWGIKSTMKILDEYKVAISPRAINILAKLVGETIVIRRNFNEYINLMNLLTKTGLNLLEIINLTDKYYNYYYHIINSDKTHFCATILQILRKRYSRTTTTTGKHTIRYALLSMREEELSKFLPHNEKTIKGTNISSDCFPFECNPMICNITGKKITVNIQSALDIVDNKDNIDCSIPYLNIKKNMQETGELFFDVNEIKNSDKIKDYNDLLDDWSVKKGYRILMDDNNKVYIDSEVRITKKILTKLYSMSNSTNLSQQKQNDSYLNETDVETIDYVKKLAIKNVFVDSNIMLIYGAAGTGKTTLIKYISDLMKNSTKLYVANTNTALQNLKRRIGNDEVYKTVKSIVNNKNDLEYDVIFIDECSTIDNRSMELLLHNIKPTTKIVLTGDIYQIESIDYGNWFYYAKEIITKSTCNVELTHNWRTEDDDLKSLWAAVREKDEILTERLVIDGPYSEDLGENIFKSYDEDEIVLCLNYDGKFGLNSINQYFQNANTKNEAVVWQEWKYKVGDKILFLDTRRFQYLYNNLKGTIENIEKSFDKISFTIKVNTTISKKDCISDGLKLIGYSDNKTIVQFDVYAGNDEMDDDEKKKTVVPFQLAYAVTIHKAQGLEYNSVKIVIPTSNTEKITHSIFYTAITRTRKKLKIYWSSETMNSVVKEFYNDKDNIYSLSKIKNYILANSLDKNSV